MSFLLLGMLRILALHVHYQLYYSLASIDPSPYCKQVDVIRTHCLLRQNYSLAIFIVGLIQFFSQISNHIATELILKLWIFKCVIVDQNNVELQAYVSSDIFVGV
jgi:hypothetical protein